MEGKAGRWWAPSFRAAREPVCTAGHIIGSSGGISSCTVTLQCSRRGACEGLTAPVLELVNSSLCKFSSPHAGKWGVE